MNTSKPVRVLHVITGLGVGGAESMLTSLVGARPPELEQRVVSLVANGLHAGEIRKRGTSVVELAFDHPAKALTNLWALARLIRNTRPHIVQGWMYHGNLAALAGVRLAGRRRTTTVAWGIRCSHRDVSVESIQLHAVVRVGVPLSRFADVLVANSQAGLDFHQSYGYRSKEMLVVPNGIDTDRFRPDPEARERLRHELHFGSTALLLAHVARVHPMKDHAMLLDVAQRLPQVNVLAIGAGTDSLPSLPNLRRLGGRRDVPAVLAASDIIASTSVFGEGFSNAIAEGMAAGLVPVATNVGDAREIIGDTGFVVPTSAPRKMADALETLAALSREELVARGSRARERIKTRFSLDEAIQNFTHLYTRIAAERPTSSADESLPH